MSNPEENRYPLNYYESIFRNSTSRDEIFDAFNLAVKNKIYDKDLYKILLANPALSNEEIIMYTEKLCKERKELGYDLYNWTGYLFYLKDRDFSLLDNSLYYFQKAFMLNPEEYKPLISALSLYNYEIDLPANADILRLVNTGLSKVKKKSVIYRQLSKHYGKLGNEELCRKFSRLAERSRREENQ
jgi:hypothetical protein